MEGFFCLSADEGKVKWERMEKPPDHVCKRHRKWGQNLSLKGAGVKDLLLFPSVTESPALPSVTEMDQSEQITALTSANRGRHQDVFKRRVCHVKAGNLVFWICSSPAWCSSSSSSDPENLPASSSPSSCHKPGTLWGFMKLQTCSEWKKPSVLHPDERGQVWWAGGTSGTSARRNAGRGWISARGTFQPDDWRGGWNQPSSSLKHGKHQRADKLWRLCVAVCWPRPLTVSFTGFSILSSKNW